MATMDILDPLIDIHPCLRCRIRVHSEPASNPLSHHKSHDSSGNFVLYLPTVNLRFDQNPSFSLACHLANHFQLPLLVLVVVLDDTFLPLHSKWENFKPIVMTSRRLAFWLEAISAAGRKWHEHGASVMIRVHGPQCRYPDHLTLSVRSRVVVTDEPFVYPFLSLVQSVERACRSASVPCFRVDGSTTVPPSAILKKIGNDSSPIFYSGVPAKAWLWQKKTEEYRMKHIKAAMMDGAFDPPVLLCKIICSDLLLGHLTSNFPVDDFVRKMTSSFPERWHSGESSAPGERPWMIHELNQLLEEQGLREWALKWPGADPSVPPCPQTIGTLDAGMKRWNLWIHDRKGLQNYAQRRLVYEVKLAQESKVTGADKFEEEIIKWREMSYAHAFSRSDYCTSNCIPSFARKSLEQNPVIASYHQLTLSQIELGETADVKWNSMQQYLRRTGELHNNVRMTWGKTISTVWHNRISVPSTLSRSEGLISLLCYMNDRYALDGLAPPSYGGILWCFGWCDNPSASRGGITPKNATHYKMTAADFKMAETNLLAIGEEKPTQKSIIDLLSTPTVQKKKRLLDDPSISSRVKNKQSRGPIDVFFAR